MSDADRDDAATLLRDHAGDGRLTTDELGGRLERVFAARTRAELDAPLADLPRRAPARELAHRARKAQEELRAHVVSYAGVCTLMVGIWLAAGMGYFWPVWVIGGWGIGVVSHVRAARAEGAGRRRLVT